MEERGGQIVLRKEHGVIFDKLSMIETTASKWVVVLVVDLPRTQSIEMVDFNCQELREANTLTNN